MAIDSTRKRHLIRRSRLIPSDGSISINLLALLFALSIRVAEILCEVTCKHFIRARRVASHPFEIIRGAGAPTLTVVLKILTIGFGNPLWQAHADHRFARGPHGHVYIRHILTQRFRESTGHVVEG